MAIQTFYKQPNDVLDYDVDYRDWLKARGNDTIKGAPVITFDVGITLVSSVVYGGIVKMYFSGGVNLSRYKVTVRVNTNGGRTKEAEFYLSIKEA